jgi:hypothetical protein
MERKMQTNKAILGISFLFLVSSCAYLQKSPLQLTMKSDKEEYEVGEEITLHCQVRNASDMIIKFYPYNQKNIDMRDIDGSRCITELLPRWENAEPMVTLRPNEVFEYTLKGNISKRTGGISYTYQEGKLKSYAKGQYREVFGIFVDFPWNAYYLSENYGKYKIVSYFKDGNVLSNEYINLIPEKREIFLKDKWQGNLTSNGIIIEIKK